MSEGDCREDRGARCGLYILAVKSNQPKLFDALVDFFDDGIKHGFGRVPCEFHETVEKDHGRLETRRHWTFGQVDWLMPEQQWNKLSMVGMIESVREINGVWSDCPAS